MGWFDEPRTEFEIEEMLKFARLIEFKILTSLTN
jgi:hypothetical protein